MVTWEALGAVGAILLGLLLCGFAVLAYFAAGMSTNPGASRDAERSARKAGLVGLALVAIGGWILAA